MVSRNGLTGKTYEEFYGEKRAQEIKKTLSKLYKGKTFEERHGIEKAKQIKEKMNSVTHTRIKKDVHYCSFCKKSFYRTIYAEIKNKFCSRKCLGEWNKFHNIKPPSRKGTVQTEETKIKKSVAMKKMCESVEYRNKMRERSIFSNPETHPLRKMAIKRKEQGLYRGFISSQQDKLFLIIKNNFKGSTVDLEYPIKYKNKNMFLDVAVIESKLNFEYDGEYWHKDKEKDNRRDKKIKKLGWKIYRINKNNIKDIHKIIGKIKLKIAFASNKIK